MNEITASSAVELARKHLSSIGLSIEDLAKLVPDLQQGETLLLVGSVPEGLSTAASDIDLLRIGHSRGRGFVRPFSAGTESAWRLSSGATINIEAWNLNDVEALGRRVLEGFRAIDGELDNDGLESHIQHYNAAESLFLHRCSTGVILAGEALALKLRRDYRIGEISLQFLMYSFLAYSSAIEKASRQAALGADLSALWMATQAMDHMALTMLASVGESNPHCRWRVRLLERSSEALGPERVDRLFDFLFPARGTNAQRLIAAAKEFGRAEVGRIIARMPKNIAKWPSLPEFEFPSG
jgi:hypothetical protein